MYILVPTVPYLIKALAMNPARGALAQARGNEWPRFGAREAKSALSLAAGTEEVCA